MDDAMGVYATMNRRSNPPTRIGQDRPHGLAKQLLWETIKTQDETAEPIQEQHVDRTINSYTERGERGGTLQNDVGTFET